MTIAIGFVCTNGIVLCADSLQSDGLTKRMVAKLWHYQVGEDWGVAIASAGNGDLADSFNEELEKILGNSDFNERKLRAKIKNKVSAFRKDYPDEPLDMLLGIFSKSEPFTKWLYRFCQKAMWPIPRYQSVGIGEAVSNLICSQIYTPLMNVDEARRLGILTILRVKEHVEYCGGPTWVTSYETGAWFWNDMSRAEITDIEKGFEESGFREALQAYWLANTPPPAFPGGYKWFPEKGIKWKIEAKLNSRG